MSTHSSRSVGMALRSLRQRTGRSLPDVCKAADISAAQLRSIELGSDRPAIAVLDRVARSLGTTLPKVVRDGASEGSATTTLAEIASAILALPDGDGSKVDRVEAAVVLHAMAVCLQNQSAAARLLGMERKAFVRRFAKAKERRY
jgi:transcriptional regulator with XRE-family HTH domain